MREEPPVKKSKTRANKVDEELEKELGRVDTILEWRESPVQVGMLDVRPTELFKLGHVVDSTNIPLAELNSRVMELPPKGKGIYVIGNDSSKVEQAKQMLQDLSYVILHSFVLTDSLIKSLQKKDRELEKKLSPLRLWWDDSQPVPSLPKWNYVEGTQSKILWEPSPCLRENVEAIEDFMRQTPVREDKNKPTVALDLACGSGRDAVYLALRGWKVVAIDYRDTQLHLLKQLASHHGISCATVVLFREKPSSEETDPNGFLKEPELDLPADLENVQIVGYQWDLEKEGLPLLSGTESSTSSSSSSSSAVSASGETHRFIPDIPSLPEWARLGGREGGEEKFELVTVSRYLHRPHLPLLPHFLRSNGTGFLCYHTFMVGCELISRPKRKQFLLDEGELRNLYVRNHSAVCPSSHSESTPAESSSSSSSSSAGPSVPTLEIWQDEVRPISDGRPTSFFLGRKLGNV